MRVIELATVHVVTIRQGATVLEAARLMRENHVGSVVIVGPNRSMLAPIGLVTDRDIVVGPIAAGVSDLERLKIEDMAAQELVVAEADQEVTDVARMMLTSGVRRVPVVNTAGALVGIVSYDDLLSNMAENLADFTRLYSRQRRREQKART
jgi:CBS domain-containing protein